MGKVKDFMKKIGFFKKEQLVLEEPRKITIDKNDSLEYKGFGIVIRRNLAENEKKRNFFTFIPGAQKGDKFYAGKELIEHKVEKVEEPKKEDKEKIKQKFIVLVSALLIPVVLMATAARACTREPGIIGNEPEPNPTPNPIIEITVDDSVIEKTIADLEDVLDEIPNLYESTAEQTRRVNFDYENFLGKEKFMAEKDIDVIYLEQGAKDTKKLYEFYDKYSIDKIPTDEKEKIEFYKNLLAEGLGLLNSEEGINSKLMDAIKAHMESTKESQEKRPYSEEDEYVILDGTLRRFTKLDKEMQDIKNILTNVMKEIQENDRNVTIDLIDGKTIVLIDKDTNEIIRIFNIAELEENAKFEQEGGEISDDRN